MKITVIGCGNMFSSNGLYNSCYLIEENGRKMLFDCGQQIFPFALKKAGVHISDIDDIWISHCHADHVGSLEAFAFGRYDWAHRTPLAVDRSLSYRAPTLICVKSVLDQLWTNTLQGGLKNSMQWFDASLESFFNVRAITTPTFNWEGWTCSPIQLVHIMAMGFITPSFGLMMQKTGSATILITADCQHLTPKQMVDFLDMSDLVIMDCETSKFPSGVHAHYKELAGYPEMKASQISDSARAKMWLTHYGDNVILGKDFDGETDCNWFKRAKEDGFAGFLLPRQTIEINGKNILVHKKLMRIAESVDE